MQLIDPAHPFYKPLWVRLLIVGSCGFWAIFEAVRGDPFFMVIMGALAIYSGRVLLLNYKTPAEETKARTTSGKTDIGSGPSDESASDDPKK